MLYNLLSHTVQYLINMNIVPNNVLNNFVPIPYYLMRLRKDNNENVLQGKGKSWEIMSQRLKLPERRLKHELCPVNAWSLISFFELFMSCSKR